MPRTVRRLGSAVSHLVTGLRKARRLDTLPLHDQHHEIRLWSGDLLRRLGVTLTIHGEPPKGTALLVSNHVSWLDIATLHACCPHARFVSKAVVGKWPLIGRLTRVVNTLFIERERKRDAMRVVREVAAALTAGDVVALFPEGTTGPGHPVLPFHPNLLEAAIAADVHVHPVLLRYAEPGMPVSVAAQYIGDTTLVGSLFKLAGARDVEVQVHFLPPIHPRGMTRRELARQAHERIATALARQIGAPAAAEGREAVPSAQVPPLDA
jgi:1-acyl-sn-glycerol-3-phosphate acyltransferase